MRSGSTAASMATLLVPALLASAIPGAAAFQVLHPRLRPAASLLATRVRHRATAARSFATSSTGSGSGSGSGKVGDGDGDGLSKRARRKNQRGPPLGETRVRPEQRKYLEGKARAEAKGQAETKARTQAQAKA